MAICVSGSTSSFGASAARSETGIVVSSAHEFVAEPIAVRLDQPGGGMRKMDRQHEPAGAGGVAEESSARLRRLFLVPVEDGRPVGLAALQRVVHQIADHHR